MLDHLPDNSGLLCVLLLSSGHRCAQRPVESLQDAAKAGDLEAAKRLLAEGANVNGKDAKGITPLGVAVGFNKVPIIKLLLESDADVEQTDPKGNTALHYAAGKQRVLSSAEGFLISKMIPGF